MLKSLFFVLLVSLVANADDINNLSDVVVKDINGEDFEFEQLEGKCVLIVNTASMDNIYTHYNMIFLNELHENYRDLEIIAVPSNSFGQEPKNTQDLQMFFVHTWGAKYHIMEKTDIRNSDLFRFLTSISRKPDRNFNKYLIKKDGNTAKWYGAQECTYYGAMYLEKQIRKCLASNRNEAKVTKITDLVLKDLYGNDFPLKQFEGKCILVVNTASEDSFYTHDNMIFLNELYQNYKDLEIVAIPSNSFGKEPKNTRDLQMYFARNWGAEYHIMEKTDINDSEIYEFLTSISRKPDFNFIKYLIQKDGRTAKYRGPAEWEREYTPHEATDFMKEIRDCLASEFDGSQ